MTRRQRQAKYAAEHRHMRDRLVRVYEDATGSIRDAGRVWYPNAEGVIANLAAEFQLGRPTVAAVVAVLSPRQRWRKNVEAARAILDGEPWRVGRVLDANVDKALALAAGAAPLDIVSGDKVTAFWANLNGSREAVTVDVWAQRAALGYMHRWQPKHGRYARLARAYRAGAAIVGETPREFQSIVWQAIRPAVEHEKDRRAIHATS